VLIHPWDAALDEQEWRTWLADGRDFGHLVVNGLPGAPPTAVPTHFVVEDTAAGTELLIHLARPNPVWENIAADPNVLVTVIDDYAYIPTRWRAKAGDPAEDGVPTSYYAAVQLSCRAEIIDDPAGKADLLARQLAHFQPAGDHAQVAVGAEPYGRMLPGIRGLRLHVLAVAAKFKYDDHNPTAQRAEVASRLSARATGRDTGAADQQRRRLTRIGSWRAR
jgi:transcriptional regulator